MAFDSTNTNKLASNTTVVTYADGTSAVPANVKLVNASGTVQKSKVNLKDMNDVYYVTDGAGVVLYANYKKLYTSPSTEHDHSINVGGKTYYTE